VKAALLARAATQVEIRGQDPCELLPRKGPHAEGEFRALVPEIHDLVDGTDRGGMHDREKEPPRRRGHEAANAGDAHRDVQPSEPERVPQPQAPQAAALLRAHLAAHLGDDAWRIVEREKIQEECISIVKQLLGALVEALERNLFVAQGHVAVRHDAEGHFGDDAEESIAAAQRLEHAPVFLPRQLDGAAIRPDEPHADHIVADLAEFSGA